MLPQIRVGDEKKESQVEKEIYDYNNNYSLDYLETMEANGNTVTITPLGWAASILAGGQSTEIVVQLPFSEALEEITITNVIFNGKLLQEVIE